MAVHCRRNGYMPFTIQLVHEQAVIDDTWYYVTPGVQGVTLRTATRLWASTGSIALYTISKISANN